MPGVADASEDQFVKLVNQLNQDIEFRNSTKSKTEQEQLLNLTYLLKRYRKIKMLENKKVFREIYDCEYCLYYEKPRRCPATPRKGCPLEKGIPVKEREKLPCCPNDRKGNFPYANEAATCFGFCYQKILSEFYKRREDR